MVELVGRRAQAELGVARRGQLHQPGLGRLDDRGEVAAHGRLQVGDRTAHALEEQARHAGQERLPAGKAPDVDGQVDVVAGLRVEDGVPQLCRKGADGGMLAEPAAGQLDVGAAQRDGGTTGRAWPRGRP